MKQLGTPIGKHKGAGSSSTFFSREKHHFSRSQCFLLTGPKAALCKLTQPHSTQKTRNLPLGKRIPWKEEAAAWCVLQEPQDLLYPPRAGTEATKRGPEQCKLSQKDTNWTLDRNLYDVGPRKYTPVVCKIKCVGILWVQKTYCWACFCFVSSHRWNRS